MIHEEEDIKIIFKGDIKRNTLTRDMNRALKEDIKKGDVKRTIERRH